MRKLKGFHQTRLKFEQRLVIGGSVDKTAFRRVAVVGTCGSGKTTLASELARRLCVPHIELDALYWEPNWTPADPDVFREQIETALTGEAWVVDGNYGIVRNIIWARADTVVWLNYSLPVIYWQLLRRTLKRVITKEVLWQKNVESWRLCFLSKDSLFIWAWTSAQKQRKQYPLLFQDPQYAHLNVVILRSPREMQNWLHTVRW